MQVDAEPNNQLCRASVRTNKATQADSDRPRSHASLGALTILAAVSICIYGAISLLSWRFDFESVPTERPIVFVLSLFATAFIAYLVAIRIVWRASESQQRVKLIIAAAILFRIVMLFSLPIQEVDIYRYLWDGAVSASGVSPFQYSPQQVSSADLTTTGDASLERLTLLRDRNPTLAEILRRVHFSELPTIYPLTSQAVFATANLATPAEASLLTRLFIMKAWFIAFDIATLFLVIALLRLCDKPASLCVIYAWCPLLMKEVANSGHLDAVAVFATTLAVYLVARFLKNRSVQTLTMRTVVVDLGLISVVFALAVGAKLYPIVLAPLVFLAIAKSCGWRIAFIPAIVFIVTTAVLLWPMVPGESGTDDDQLRGDPSRGVVTFLRRWEMNDYLFLVVIENLKPSDERVPQETAWFTVVPDSARKAVVNSVTTHFGIAPAEVPFLVSRTLTVIIFIILAMVIAWRIPLNDVPRFCEGAFLTLAWFWLLCPTQNPWYWTWALPLLPFARSRVWLAVSGLVFIYYLRFWMSYHFAETEILGTHYMGTAFFDFVITWLEFAPWFVLLIAGFLLRPRLSNWFDMPDA